MKGALVPPGLAVAAVIAQHGRLDQAGTIGIGAGGQPKHPVACVEPRDRRGRLRSETIGPHPTLSGNRLAHECAQLLLVHATTSTVSMIPTTGKHSTPCQTSIMGVDRLWIAERC